MKFLNLPIKITHGWWIIQELIYLLFRTISTEWIRSIKLRYRIHSFIHSFVRSFIVFNRRFQVFPNELSNYQPPIIFWLNWSKPADYEAQSRQCRNINRHICLVVFIWRCRDRGELFMAGGSSAIGGRLGSSRLMAPTPPSGRGPRPSWATPPSSHAPMPRLCAPSSCRSFAACLLALVIVGELPFFFLASLC